MPKATMREESLYSLPEDTIFVGKLNSVSIKVVNFIAKKGPNAGKPSSFNLWTWEFEITEGEFAPLRAWGETESNLNNLEEPKGRAKLARPWAETLLGRQIGLGEELDTDDLIGLPCKFTVIHEEPRAKKEGGYFYGNPVDDVFPASASSAFVPF